MGLDNKVPEGLEPEKEDYSFMKESIKDEKKDRRKSARKLGSLVGKGLIFGLAASFSFYAVKPLWGNLFPIHTQEVKIPKDEIKTDKEKKDDEKKKDKKEQALTAENYRELDQSLYYITASASKSLAEVRGVKKAKDLPARGEESGKSASGLIVGDNGQEYLILTDTSVLRDIEAVEVSFSDGSDHEASIKAKDENLGLGVVSVKKMGISESTRGQIKVAELGNSHMVNKGETIIAMGKPFAYFGGIGYGIVSSTKNYVTIADGEHQMLSTDIAGSESGTGVLINVEGQVVGIFRPSAEDGKNLRQLNALALSGIKDEIELLINGNKVPYLGIYGVEVSKEIAEEYDMPKGLYVKEVLVDSPAMEAGIQCGDIITHVSGKKIVSVSGYHKELLEHQNGDIIRVTGRRQGKHQYEAINFTVEIGNK